MKISRVEFRTNEVETLQDFYYNTMGLPLISSSKNSFEIAAGETKIAFSKSESGRQPFYHFALNVPENQRTEAKNWLQKRVDILADENGNEDIFFKGLNSHSLYFFDPTGNLCEFTFRHELDNSSEKEFTGNSVLSASEVGLPVENVSQTAIGVSNSLNIPLAVDDVDNYSIVAVGSPESAIVVAPLGDHWFMTNKKAESHPIQITISSGESAEYCHSGHPYKMTMIE